jgi:hypothetical protein
LQGAFRFGARWLSLIAPQQLLDFSAARALDEPVEALATVDRRQYGDADDENRVCTRVGLSTTLFGNEAVIEDPNVFAEPWLITRTVPFLPEHNRVDEFFCENNRDYKPLFGAK